MKSTLDLGPGKGFSDAFTPSVNISTRISSKGKAAGMLRPLPPVCVLIT